MKNVYLEELLVTCAVIFISFSLLILPINNTFDKGQNKKEHTYHSLPMCEPLASLERVA
jgi:hypothetical protein